MSATPEERPPLPPLKKAGLFLRLLGRPALARKLGTLVTEGYLVRTGWVRSVTGGEIVDEAGQPQPWTTFPLIDFLGPRLRREWCVFEYGAGASTRYFSIRVRTVMAVEHDEAFALRLRPLLGQNVQLLVEAGGTPGYAGAIRHCAEPPQLVSVDGVDRVACTMAALAAIAPDGVLLLDDAERPEYAPAHAALAAAGWRVVEFWGLAPGRVQRKCSSIFYRRDNVLGL